MWCAGRLLRNRLQLVKRSLGNISDFLSYAHVYSFLPLQGQEWQRDLSIGDIRTVQYFQDPTFRADLMRCLAVIEKHRTNLTIVENSIM